MKNATRFPQTALLILSTVFCLVAFYTVQTSIRLKELSSQVQMLRGLSIGRTRSEVIQWMGLPDSIDATWTTRSKLGRSAMVYKSVAPSRQRLNGQESVWVFLDKNNVVTGIYYTDDERDRQCLQLKKKPESVIDTIRATSTLAKPTPVGPLQK